MALCCDKTEGPCESGLEKEAEGVKSEAEHERPSVYKGSTLFSLIVPRRSLIPAKLRAASLALAAAFFCAPSQREISFRLLFTTDIPARIILMYRGFLGV